MKFSISARHAAVAALPLLAITFCGVPSALAQSTPDLTQPWNWSDEFVRSQVNQVRAGRNLNPDTWPGGARVAVLLSFDVDNETVLGLRTGEISIGPLSQGQYGARVALPRIVKLMDAENIPATFFFPAWSLKLAPEQADVINNSGNAARGRRSRHGGNLLSPLGHGGKIFFQLSHEPINTIVRDRHEPTKRHISSDHTSRPGFGSSLKLLRRARSDVDLL